MIKYPLEVNTSLVRVENALHKLECKASNQIMKKIILVIVLKS